MCVFVVDTEVFWVWGGEEMKVILNEEFHIDVSKITHKQENI